MKKKIDIPAAVALILYGGLMVAFAESRGDPFWVRYLLAALAGACFLIVMQRLLRGSGAPKPHA
jgi:uncharacterized membrane protein YeaQ/YmgE (transglycosylase-associated protein family)